MKIMMIALCALIFACCPKPSEAPGVLDPKDCDSACARLESLDCRSESGHRYAELVPGLRCDDGCRLKIQQGLELHPSCVANASDCAQVDQCAL
jgi:hypothetical protein